MFFLCKDYNTCMLNHIYNNGGHKSLKTTMYNKNLLKKDAYTETLDMALNLILSFQTPGNVPCCTVPDRKSKEYILFN